MMALDVVCQNTNPFALRERRIESLCPDGVSNLFCVVPSLVHQFHTMKFLWARAWDPLP